MPHWQRYYQRMTASLLCEPRSLSFLDLLNADDRSALLCLGRPRAYRRGASITVQGDHSDTVFVLLRGWVKVILDTVDGQEIVLSVLGPGDLLGEFEAIDGDGGPRTAGNVSLEPVNCQVLVGDEFRAYLENHPRAALTLMRVIIHRLRTADRRRTDSGSLDTVHRLSRLLVELADAHGRPTKVGLEIEIPLKQQELASLISSSRESVVRALRSLRSRGLVATGRHRISVCDLAALRQHAKSEWLMSRVPNSFPKARVERTIPAIVAEHATGRYGLTPGSSSRSDENSSGFGFVDQT
jgi:CRP/FNR family transcriptional regulator, cyclic AMP receptor protein